MFESRLYQDILQEEVNALDCFASEDGSIWNGMMEDETFEEELPTVSPNPINMRAFQVVESVKATHLMGYIPPQDQTEFISMLKAIGDSDYDGETDDTATVTSTSVSSTVSDENMTLVQCEQWRARYLELAHYRERFGNCHIPYDWTPNRPLSQWVKRQRHQRRLKKEGKHSNLTEEREKLLDDLGFIWDSRAANWEERFDELVLFKAQHGHSKVTCKYGQAYRPLAVWLKRQRHSAREFIKGKPETGMTDDRVSRLVSIGVNLNIRRSK